MLCSNCGFELEDGDKFCYICGKPVVLSVPTTDTKDSATSTEIIDTEKQPSDVIKEHTDAKLLCPVCGFELEAGDQFCYKCGTPVVEETKAVAESDVEAVKAIEDIADVSDNAKAEGEQIVAEALAEEKPTSQDTGDGTIDTEQAVHEDPADEYICCKCGLVLSRDDKFCYKCGTPVVIEGTTETEPVSESVDVSSNEEQTKVVDAGTDEQLIEKENNSTDYEQFKENAIDDSPVKAEENNEAFSVPGIVQEQEKSAVAEPVKEQVSEEPTGGVFCSNCGFKLNADDKFCYKCGRSVTTNTEHETNKVEVIQRDKDETGKLQKDQTKANSRLSKTEITEAVVGIGIVAILVVALALACIFLEHNKNSEVIRAANTFAQALVKQDAGKIIKLTDEKKDSEASQYIVNLLDTTKYSDDKNAFIKAVGETMTFEIDESTLIVDKDKASVNVVFTMVDYEKALKNKEYYDVDELIADLAECDDTKKFKVKFEFEKKGDSWSISNLKDKDYCELYNYYSYEPAIYYDNAPIIEAASMFATAIIDRDCDMISALTSENNTDTLLAFELLFDESQYSDVQNEFIKAVSDTITYQIDVNYDVEVNKDEASVDVVFSMVDYEKALMDDYSDIDEAKMLLNNCEYTMDIIITFEFEKIDGSWFLSNLDDDVFDRILGFYSYEMEFTDTTPITDEEPQPSTMEITVQSIDGEVITGLFYFTYDDDRLIQVALYGDGETLTDELVLQYDSYGNCTVDYSYGYNLYYGFMLDCYYKYYDESSFLIAEERSDGMYYTTYENDSYGNPITINYYEYYDGYEEWYMTDELYYDEFGRCTFVHRENFGGGWTQDTSYYYNGSESRPYYCETVIADAYEQNTYTTTFTYQYDDFGRMVSKVEDEVYPDNKGNYITTTVYTYD